MPKYQIWLSATPFSSDDLSEKSEVLFSSADGFEAIFKIFNLLKTELDRPRESLDHAGKLFEFFYGEDLSSSEKIDETLIRTLEELVKKNEVIVETVKILKKLRENRIETLKSLINEYLKDKKNIQKKLQDLWYDRTARLSQE